MKTNLIIIAVIVLNIASDKAKATPAEQKSFFSCFPSRKTPQDEPSVVTPLRPTIQASDEDGCFERIKNALCICCCCPCLAIWPFCKRAIENQ